MTGNCHHSIPPRGAGLASPRGRWPSGTQPLHRHTPPRRSGFGTDRREGVRSTAAPWAPPAPKGAGGSVTILLQSQCGHPPFACGPGVLLPLWGLCRLTSSGAPAQDAGLRRSRPRTGFLGSARRNSRNIGGIEASLAGDQCKPGKPDASADGDPGRLCVAAIAAAQACITLLLRCLDLPMGYEVHLGVAIMPRGGELQLPTGSCSSPPPPEAGRYRPLGAVSTRHSIGA